MSNTQAKAISREEPVTTRKRRRRGRNKKNLVSDSGIASHRREEHEIWGSKKTVFDGEQIGGGYEENGVVRSGEVGSDSGRKEGNNCRVEVKKDKVRPVGPGCTRPKRAKVVEFYGGEKDVGKDAKVDEDDETYFRNASLSSFELRQRARELLEIRKKLPIYQHQAKIVEYVETNPVTVIIGETGSGKSTQIPQFFMARAKKQIAVTQPRRVAAASLAARVSEEYGCKLGQEVGFQVRFSNVTTAKTTKLKYLTDGMLLREIMIDSTLAKYSTIVIDEAHERTILTDLIIGFLKQLLTSKQRPDLKVVIMSATLNADLFSKFFNNAPILYIEGKMYPVTKYYMSDSPDDLVDTMIRSIVQVDMTEPEGDILCFVPGQEEIDSIVSALKDISPQLPKGVPQIVPLPLYAALSPAQQLKIFEKVPKNERKVILATNIAETSITVPGVKYVIDSGLRKVKAWKHQLGLSTLLTTPISQASAKQRAGRAGRESPGKAFRLYLESVFHHSLPKQQESEILRNDIVLPVLTLKKLGINDLLNWTWLEFPGEASILGALSTLYSLGALDNSGQVTALGRKVSVLPLPPQLSVVLITALENGVLGPVIDIASCLSVDNLILNVGHGDGELRDEINFKRRNFCTLGETRGDLIALWELFRYFQELHNDNKLAEAKEWCSEMYFSYKGFRNALRIRQQLFDYMLTTVRADINMLQNDQNQQMRNMKAQMSTASESFDKADFDLDSEVASLQHLKNLDVASVLKSFLKGYITNTAIGMPDRSYRTSTAGQPISIHPSSILFGKTNINAIMYIEYVFTAKGYARNCSAIELSWLQDVAPQLLGASKEGISS